jgi:molecular chaperone GrpE
MQDENKSKSDDNETSAAQESPGAEGTAPTKTELDLARDEAERWKKDYLYLRADFDNYRKTVVKERSDLIKYGTERFLVDLLDVIDNFERALALEIDSTNFTQFKEGIQMTSAEFHKILEKHGVKEVPAAGEPFNPNFHEALTSEETTAVPAGHVSRVFKKAFKLHDRVLRPAQVVVAAAPKS